MQRYTKNGIFSLMCNILKIIKKLHSIVKSAVVFISLLQIYFCFFDYKKNKYTEN